MTKHVTLESQVVVVLFTCSLQKNNISDAGAQALAKGLQYCTNLQRLE